MRANAPLVAAGFGSFMCLRTGGGSDRIFVVYNVCATGRAQSTWCGLGCTVQWLGVTLCLGKQKCFQLHNTLYTLQSELLPDRKQIYCLWYFWGPCAARRSGGEGLPPHQHPAASGQQWDAHLARPAGAIPLEIWLAEETRLYTHFLLTPFAWTHGGQWVHARGH